MCCQAELKRRQDLVILNSCLLQNCIFCINEACTHELDTVDKRTGANSCPLKPYSIERMLFKG